MSFGRNSLAQGSYMRPGATANGAANFVNHHTLLMDLSFPASSSGQWRALLQTDPFNHSGNDAEFFVGSSSSLPDANGIGAENQFNGSLAPDTWYRIAFIVDLSAPAGQQLAKYINGSLIGTQSLAGGIDGRFALGPAALLFSCGMAGFTQPGYVSSIQFINGAMSASQIAGLGGPTAAKLPPGDAALRINTISRAGSNVTLNWSGPTGQFQIESTT